MDLFMIFVLVSVLFFMFGIVLIIKYLLSKSENKKKSHLICGVSCLCASIILLFVIAPIFIKYLPTNSVTVEGETQLIETKSNK